MSVRESVRVCVPIWLGSTRVGVVGCINAFMPGQNVWQNMIGRVCFFHKRTNKEIIIIITQNKNLFD